MYLKFEYFFLCEGNNEGQSLVLISIKRTHTFCLYTCTGAFSNDKECEWGREGRGYSE
jgi:hypothetical protein